MIVVTTPTGKIGSQLVPQLIAAGEKVRVIARDSAKLSPRIRGEVDLVQGSPDDPKVLSAAFEGAEAVFLVVPFPYSAEDIVEHYLRFVRPAAEALKLHDVKRLVYVSGLRAASTGSAGEPSLATAVDRAVSESGCESRALWCAGFMENLLAQIESIKRSGTFFMLGSPDVKEPLVATRDIAATAARLLHNRAWKGRGGVAVLGPEDLSFNDMAVIMSEVLGAEIRCQRLSEEAYKAQLVKAGGSAAVARWLVQMRADSERNPHGSIVRNAENTTPYSFREWCEEVLKPAVKG